jgi:hypothetical protein
MWGGELWGEEVKQEIASETMTTNRSRARPRHLRHGQCALPVVSPCTATVVLVDTSDEHWSNYSLRFRLSGLPGS